MIQSNCSYCVRRNLTDSPQPDGNLIPACLPLLVARRKCWRRWLHAALRLRLPILLPIIQRRQGDFGVFRIRSMHGLRIVAHLPVRLLAAGERERLVSRPLWFLGLGVSRVRGPAARQLVLMQWVKITKRRNPVFTELRPETNNQ